MYALGRGLHQFAITEQANVVGSIGLQIGKHQTGYVGYWLAREARGRGMATRALRRLSRYGLDDLSLERLELTADVEKGRSQRVAETLLCSVPVTKRAAVRGSGRGPGRCPRPAQRKLVFGAPLHGTHTAC